MHEAVATTVAQLGRLDILVCCAGVLGAEVPFLEQTAAEFERVQRINLHGVFYAHQAAVPRMLERGWGRCVTITSNARQGATHVVPYACSKGAVWSLVRALGNAWPQQNVFVNGVEPGRALTDMVVPRFTQEFLDNPPVAIGRYSDAEEVAEVVEFLTSERNTYTTGSVWSVQGRDWLEGPALTPRPPCPASREPFPLAAGALQGEGLQEHVQLHNGLSPPLPEGEGVRGVRAPPYPYHSTKRPTDARKPSSKVPARRTVNALQRHHAL